MQKVLFKNNIVQQNFEQQGFASLGHLPNALLEQMDVLYKSLPVKWNSTGFYSSMMIDDPAYRASVTQQLSNLLQNFLSVFLEGYEILFVNFLVKLPNTDNYIGMHQDWNFVDEHEAESLNFWLPLVDVNDRNGNFYMVESSHNYFKQLRGTPYFNYYKGYESRFEEMATALTPARGEVILYHGRILHFSKPNFSGEARVAVGGVLVPKGARLVHYKNSVQGNKLEWQKFYVDRNFFGSFLPDSEINGYPFEKADNEPRFNTANMPATIQNFFNHIVSI